jgi:hypothetical protein
MKNFKISLALAGFAFSGFVSAPLFAQTTPVPDHPRENEVNQRLNDQQARIQQGEAGKQAARDEAHDANIARREAVDESKHNGHITKAEQRRLNRSENRNSNRIYHQKHS